MKSNMEIYITLKLHVNRYMYNRQPMRICCMTQETQMGTLYQPSRVDGEGVGREVQKGGNMCIPMAD